MAAPEPVCLWGHELPATLQGSSQEAFADAQPFPCRKYRCARGGGQGCLAKTLVAGAAPTLHWTAEHQKRNSRGSFCPWKCPGAAGCPFQRGNQNARSGRQVKPCKAAETPGQPQLQAAQGARSRDTNKAQAAAPPRGELRVTAGALTLPRKPPGSGHRLGLAAGTATLPSSLRAGEQASREQGQRSWRASCSREPGAGRPAAAAAALQSGAAAGIRGGGRGGSERRLGARSGAPGASSAEVRARTGPARAQRVRDCGRRTRGRGSASAGVV